MKLAYLISILLLLSVSFIAAEEFGYGRTEDIPTNYSLVPTVNSSDFWDNLDVPTDITNSEFWYNHTSDTLLLNNDIFLNLSGTNANQNIDIGGWDFTTSGDITTNGGTMFMSEYFRHVGNTETYVRFSTDRMRLVAGGVNFFDGQLTTTRIDPNAFTNVNIFDNSAEDENRYVRIYGFTNGYAKEYGNLQLVERGADQVFRISSDTGEIDFDDENLATTGTVTNSKTIINQLADEEGLQVNGYDDKSGESAKIFVDSDGYGNFKSSNWTIISGGERDTGDERGFRFQWRDTWADVYGIGGVGTLGWYINFKLVDDKGLIMGGGNDFKFGVSSADSDNLHLVTGTNLDANILLNVNKTTGEFDFQDNNITTTGTGTDSQHTITKNVDDGDVNLIIRNTDTGISSAETGSIFFQFGDGGNAGKIVSSVSAGSDYGTLPVGADSTLSFYTANNNVDVLRLSINNLGEFDFQGSDISAGKITSSDQIVVDNLNLNGHTISSGDSTLEFVANDITTTGEYHILADSKKYYTGAGDDASIYYNASDMIINPKEVGSGKLFVLGDLDVTGNFIGNQIYGEMWYHNHTGTTLNFPEGVWNSLYFTNATYLNGFSYVGGFMESSNLTSQVSGLYQAVYRLSGSGQNNHLYHSSILINNVAQDNCGDHKKMSAGGDIVPMGNSCFIELSAGDDVTVAVMDYGGTGTGDYYSGSLNLIRVGT